jgi:uncharacterized protein (DUF433 family)
MNLPDFLTCGPLGDIRLTGHRIELYHVMKSFNEGHSAEMLHHEYPTLPLGLIDKVLAFYFDNKGDVDHYVTEVENELDRQAAAHEPSSGELRIRALVAESAARAKSARESSITLNGGMSMHLPEFLTGHEKGEIRLTGHRIDLCDLVPLYNEGNSAEMLLGFFPTLSLALIHKVIAFYLENNAEIDAYVARCESASERQQATTRPAPTIDELKARLHSKTAVPTA